MSTESFNEAVEQTTLAWLESIAWQVRNWVEIAPGGPTAECDDYGQVVLAERLLVSLLPLVSGSPLIEDAEKFAWIVGRAV